MEEIARNFKEGAETTFREATILGFGQQQVVKKVSSKRFRGSTLKLPQNPGYSLHNCPPPQGLTYDICAPPKCHQRRMLLVSSHALCINVELNEPILTHVPSKQPYETYRAVLVCGAKLSQNPLEEVVLLWYGKNNKKIKATFPLPQSQFQSYLPCSKQGH